MKRNRGRRPKVVIPGFKPTPKGRYERAPHAGLSLHPVVEKYTALWVQWHKHRERINEIVDGSAKVWPFPDLKEYLRYADDIQA